MFFIQFYSNGKLVPLRSKGEYRGEDQDESMQYQ